MLIRNKRSYGVEIVATGQHVEAGAEVEVDDDEIAEALLLQTDAWAKSKAAKVDHREKEKS